MTRQLPRTRGPLHAVACPCCGYKMDLRQMLRKHHLATGMEIICDHCQDVAVVAAINTDGPTSVDEVALRPKRG